MCRRVTCKQCGKPSWAGCGAHVEAVLGDVPKGDRCRCREAGVTSRPTQAKAGVATKSGALADQSTMARFKSWLRQ